MKVTATHTHTHTHTDLDRTTRVLFEITDDELERARITADLRPPPPETTHEWLNYLNWLHRRIREAAIYKQPELEEMGIKS